MKHIMLWVFAYFLGSQWQVLSFFLFQVSMRQTAQILCFSFLLCELGKLWNLILLVLTTLKSYIWSPYMPSPDDTCFGNGRNSESWNPKNTKLEVLVRFHGNFLSHINITGTEILSSSFWPKLSKADKQRS